MSRDNCQYCGGRANAWCGLDAWCSAPACRLAHDWATCEPQFFIFMQPTPMQRVGGWFMAAWFNFLSHFASGAWIVYETGCKQRFACWIYSNAYFWEERARGRI